jgi:hypothetical protein
MTVLSNRYSDFAKQSQFAAEAAKGAVPFRVLRIAAAASALEHDQMGLQFSVMPRLDQG